MTGAQEQAALDMPADPIDVLTFAAHRDGVAIYSPADHRVIGVLVWNDYHRPSVTDSRRIGWRLELWRVTMNDEPQSWWLDRRAEVLDRIKAMLADRFDRCEHIARVRDNVWRAARQRVTPDRFALSVRECRL